MGLGREDGAHRPHRATSPSLSLLRAVSDSDENAHHPGTDHRRPEPPESARKTEVSQVTGPSLLHAPKPTTPSGARRPRRPRPGRHYLLRSRRPGEPPRPHRRARERPSRRREGGDGARRGADKTSKRVREQEGHEPSLRGRGRETETGFEAGPRHAVSQNSADKADKNSKRVRGQEGHEPRAARRVRGDRERAADGRARGHHSVGRISRQRTTPGGQART